MLEAEAVLLFSTLAGSFAVSVALLAVWHALIAPFIPGTRSREDHIFRAHVCVCVRAGLHVHVYVYVPCAYSCYLIITPTRSLCVRGAVARADPAQGVQLQLQEQPTRQGSKVTCYLVITPAASCCLLPARTEISLRVT